MVPRPNVEEERKTQIVASALRCFARDGYERTSMDAIAREAGLSKALIYYYYQSKDEVFEAGFDYWMSQVTESFTALAQQGQPSERLRRLAEMTIDLGEGSIELFGLLLDYWSMARRRSSLTQRFREDMRAMRSVLAGVLKEGVRLGEFMPMDTELAAAVLFAALDGLWAHWILDPDSIDLPQAAKTTVDLFLRGILREAP
jgi:AcrR family transcriptional regulator